MNGRIYGRDGRTVQSKKYPRVLLLSLSKTNIAGSEQSSQTPVARGIMK